MQDDPLRQRQAAVYNRARRRLSWADSAASLVVLVGIVHWAGRLGGWGCVVALAVVLPLIFGGVRTSMVNVIATATIAPLAGINTLGDPIINVSGYGDTGRLAAAMCVAALAIFTELALGAVQRAVTPAGLKLETDTASRRMRLRFGREATT